MNAEVTIIGGGMITQDQLLPSLYHLQRQNRIGAIRVCASSFETLEKLRGRARLARSFSRPGASRRSPQIPDPRQPELYREVLSRRCTRQG